MSKTLKINLSVKGIESIQKELQNMQKKLKKYDGTHSIKLSYSQDEWDKMTDYEKNEAIEEAKTKYIEDIKKGVFK